jgi:hypothetical protein
MTFESALSHHFPGAIPDLQYLAKTRESLERLGFHRDNSLACVGVCRDELTHPFVRLVEQVWGEAFNFSSRAGMLFLGKSGISAAQHHAPQVDGRERFIYFAFPHIGISESGQPGQVLRPGQTEPTAACGALKGLVGNLSHRSYSMDVDVMDIELSLLKWKLINLGENDDYQDIVSITKLAHAIIAQDLKALVGEADMDQDYAMLTGIEIHTAYGYDMIWPGGMTARVDGQIYTLQMD